MQIQEMMCHMVFILDFFNFQFCYISHELHLELLLYAIKKVMCSTMYKQKVDSHHFILFLQCALSNWNFLGVVLNPNNFKELENKKARTRNLGI